MSSPTSPSEQPQGHGAPQGYAQQPQAHGAQPSYEQSSAPQGYAPQGNTPQAYAPQQGQPPQPYAPQQGYVPQPQPGAQGQPQPYGGGPTGELVVTLQKPFGAMGMITPIVTIDGYPATATWGRNSFPAPTGVRRVDVASSYLWTYGRASMTVDVQQGRTSEVFYIGPMWTIGMGGRMGTEPQKRPGKGLFIGLMAFIAAVLVLAIVLGALAGS